MCGRFTLATPDQGTLRARFPQLGESVAIERRFNVAPGDDILAVTAERGGELLHWGLLPGYTTINARAETLVERPAFREAFRRRRCLVVADGFYEWQRRPGGGRRAFWITRTDGAPFAFAGLWAQRDGARRCAIVTTTPAPALSHVHDRMPVILPPDAEEPWLHGGVSSEALRDLCVPFEDVALTAVGPKVNDARFDDPACLEPPPGEPSAPQQLGLLDDHG